MKKRSLKVFLKDEINKNKIKDLKDNKSFLFLNGTYLVFAIFLIFSNSLNINPNLFSVDVLRGIVAQLQVMVLLYLTLNFAVKGLIAALVLNIFSLSSLISLMIIENTVAYMPGVIAYITALIIMYFIYDYEQEINLKVEELKKEKKKLKYMAYYDNLTEIANREMLIDRLDYLSSMSDSELIKYKLLFIDFKNFKKLMTPGVMKLEIIFYRK